jgi:hypothetical protein
MSWARLNKKEIPYLITILVAIVGWSITHVADRVLKSPVVEYSTSVDTTSEPRTIKVTILNLSNKAFVNLRFELQGQGVKACNVPMSFRPPAWASNSVPEEGTDGVGFVISQLQPNWKVTMCGEYRGGGKDPLFVLKDGSPDQSIELRQPDLATWILKHEAELMIVLAAIGSLGVVAWIVFGIEAK